MKRIQTELAMKSTGELQKQVKLELQMKDPSIDKAMAILQNDESEDVSEDTKGNDRGASDRDDQ
jgi:hypothetical protein|tara:strand:- start:1081 stop:1272 length:192 start_codon:yes stop_codon:yes gene_type:complete